MTAAESVGLAYADARGRIFFDAHAEPLADGGVPRPVRASDLIPAPAGTVTAMLPGRRPLLADGRVASRRTAVAALLPAGFTRTLLPAYRRDEDAPTLPLFGYTFACAIGDTLYVAARATDAHQDWAPRTFAPGELEGIVAARRAADPANRTLAQLARCSLEYGCFTAQNAFLERGEAALPVSPRCNARCLGCISELDAAAGIPAPQTRIDAGADVDDIVRIALRHLRSVGDGIVSFGQGCEGEPLLRAPTIVRAIERIRAEHAGGTINCNTNGSLPRSLARLIDAGLDAVRISLNSFRPDVYAAYYRPVGYELDDVFASIALASERGLRVSLNVLTHPGVTDAPEELTAMRSLLERVRVDMIQTRTLNIDPDVYFAAVGRPREPLGMPFALAQIASLGVTVGNFTHVH